MSGNGEYVNVGEGKVALEHLSDEIKDTIAYTRAYADSLRSELSNNIKNIGEVLETYEAKPVDYKTVFPTLDKPVFPGKPSFGSLSLDSSWPDSRIPDPNFQEYSNYDFSFVIPTPPQEVDPNLNYHPNTYTSDMWQTLFSRVHSAILDGSYGIPGNVFSSLITMEQESRRLSQDREYRSGIAATGATGWNLPSGHITSFFAQFQAEILKKDQDALNNVNAKSFDIANANMQFFITAGTDLEKLTAATFESVENRSLEAAKATKEYLMSFYEQNVKLFLAKYEGEKTRLEAIKVQIEAITSRNDSETKIFLGRAQIIESTVNAIAAKNKGMVDARRGEVDVYVAEIGAAKDEFLGLVEQVKVNQDAVRLEIDSKLEIEKLNASIYSEKAKLAQAIALGVANIGSQGIASALGAINTSLSNTYSASEQRSEGWQNSASISEVHDYAED